MDIDVFLNFTLHLCVVGFLFHINTSICILSNTSISRVSLMCLASFLACYPWVYAQQGNGGRPVERCRNKMSDLYTPPYEMLQVNVYMVKLKSGKSENSLQ